MISAIEEGAFACKSKHFLYFYILNYFYFSTLHMCGIGTVHPLESICNSWVHLNTLSQADILRAVLQQVKTKGAKLPF